MQFNSVKLLRRFGAIIYDTFLLFAVLFFTSLAVVVPFKITIEHTLYPAYKVYIYLIAGLFFGWFWTNKGQTLGMRTWHIYVCQNNGKKLTWKHAMWRFILASFFWLSPAFAYYLHTNDFTEWALLGITPLVANYIWCLYDKENRALHDIFSKTRLIMVNNQIT